MLKHLHSWSIIAINTENYYFLNSMLLKFLWSYFFHFHFIYYCYHRRITSIIILWRVVYLWTVYLFPRGVWGWGRIFFRDLGWAWFSSFPCPANTVSIYIQPDFSSEPSLFPTPVEFTSHVLLGALFILFKKEKKNILTISAHIVHINDL